MKKIIVSFFMFFVITLYMNVHAEEIYDISIEMYIGQNESIVNGAITEIDENRQVVPFVENGITLVPLRFVADNLELDVQWIQEKQSVILISHDTVIILMIGEEKAYINGNLYKLDSCPVIKNERTFVPIRFIGEALQCDVSWEKDTQKALVRREKEVEVDINNDEVQKLFQDILNQKEFASYYGGYCDISLWDNPQNMFSGTMRELFSLLSFKHFEEKQYTKSEAETIILNFLSKGDISQSLSSYGIDNLKTQIEQGADFGSDSNEEILVGVYDGKVFDDVCIDLFGESLPKHENLAYAVGYHSFHLYNRVNLFYPYAQAYLYIVYYNEASNQYLFTKLPEKYINSADEEKLDSDTKLIKATMHNGKISLYIQHYTEFYEYSGGKSTYKGIYKNTYRKDDNGYYWISSYGMDEVEEKE